MICYYELIWILLSPLYGLLVVSSKKMCEFMFAIHIIYQVRKKLHTEKDDRDFTQVDMSYFNHILWHYSGMSICQLQCPNSQRNIISFGLTCQRSYVCKTITNLFMLKYFIIILTMYLVFTSNTVSFQTTQSKQYYFWYRIERIFL